MIENSLLRDIVDFTDNVALPFAMNMSLQRTVFIFHIADVESDSSKNSKIYRFWRTILYTMRNGLIGTKTRIVIWPARTTSRACMCVLKGAVVRKNRRREKEEEFCAPSHCYPKPIHRLAEQRDSKPTTTKLQSGRGAAENWSSMMPFFSREYTRSRCGEGADDAAEDSPSALDPNQIERPILSSNIPACVYQHRKRSAIGSACGQKFEPSWID
ncbi:hypothetical protein C8R45DRAFT_1071501 [Mycena sanguinolenta]|nr:hypothetical protein C8R45DRAFT_1071501 [Mycena sanguinolenta]